MDDLYSVPDPTDWLSTSLPALASVEAPLHCQICKEFYDTPMITSCNHTFCSRCIRTSLSQDGKCPACRTSDQASKLRNNWALQEVVAAFVAARPEALGVAKQSTEGVRVGKRKRAEESSEDAPTRTLRSKSRRIAGPGSQQDAIEIEDSEAEEEYTPDSPPPPSDGLVECPLECGKRMKEAEVFAHLDKCEDEKQERQRKGKPSQSHLNGFGTPSSQPTTRPQDRINQLNYSMLRDAALSRKLKDGGIPSWGPKQLMERRHREWVNIWNANCDSTQPRTKRELIHDLDVWERTQGGKAPSSNSLLMRKDFDGDAHSKQHGADFSRLIADARRKKNVPAPESNASKEMERSDVGVLEETPMPASQPGNDASEVHLPIREEEGARSHADDLPSTSQQQAPTVNGNGHIEPLEIRSSIGAEPQRSPPTSSQEISRQNYMLPPVTEQMVGRWD